MAIDSGQVTGANSSGTVEPFPIEHQYQGLNRRLYTKDVGDGSGTVELQSSPDGGTTWYTLVSVTLGTLQDFDTYPGEDYRFNISGGTSPDVKWWVY